MSDGNNSVTDSKGRKIEYHVLDPADMLDLLEAAGDQSTNAGYVRYASIVASVTAIDGLPLPLARKKADIKANGRRLGNEGLVAVSGALFGSPSASEDDEDKPADPVAATAKN